MRAGLGEVGSEGGGLTGDGASFTGPLGRKVIAEAVEKEVVYSKE